MKYIGFWEYDPEDVDKVIEKSLKLAEERKKSPEKFTKVLFPAHEYGYCQGFTVVEASPAQLDYTRMFCFPELVLEYTPISKSSELIELYLKMKKQS